MSSPNFIELCITGQAMLDDVDDFVDAWHDGDTGIPMWEFLGMTRDEYAAWVEHEEFLPQIVNAHRYGTSLLRPA